MKTKFYHELLKRKIELHETQKDSKKVLFLLISATRRMGFKAANCYQKHGFDENMNLSVTWEKNLCFLISYGKVMATKFGKLHSPFL